MPRSCSSRTSAMPARSSEAHAGKAPGASTGANSASMRGPWEMRSRTWENAQLSSWMAPAQGCCSMSTRSASGSGTASSTSNILHMVATSASRSRTGAFAAPIRLRSCFKANPVFAGFVVQQIGPFLHHPCTKPSPPSHAEARENGDGSRGDIQEMQGVAAERESRLSAHPHYEGDSERTLLGNERWERRMQRSPKPHRSSAPPPPAGNVTYVRGVAPLRRSGRRGCWRRP